MDPSKKIFCFTLDDQRYAFPLPVVERFLQAVAVSPVPNAPPLIHGLIDYFGTLIPVINLRHHLGLPEKPITADNCFAVVNTRKRKLAFVIEDVDNVAIPSVADLIPASSVDPNIGGVGLIRNESGIIFIYDVETFLSEKDEKILQKIIKEHTR